MSARDGSGSGSGSAAVWAAALTHINGGGVSSADTHCKRLSHDLLTPLVGTHVSMWTLGPVFTDVGVLLDLQPPGAF